MDFGGRLAFKAAICYNILWRKTKYHNINEKENAYEGLTKVS